MKSKKLKIIIFGGGGFIGSAIINRFLFEGHSLKIFERSQVHPFRQFHEGEDVEWIFGDLFNEGDVSNAMKGCDAVVHLVSTTLPKSSNLDPVFDVKTNIVASLLILDAMVVHKIKKIIFISSGGTVYGNSLYSPIDEKHPTNPISSYGITKLSIEKYLQLYAHLYDVKPVILRVSNPYGERQNISSAQGVIASFIVKALKGETIEIWGDGDVTRDYIYVGDVAEAFVKALYYDGSECIFNIGTGIGTSLNSLINIFREIFGDSFKYSRLPERSFDVKNSVLCIRLAEKELNFQPLVTMPDGLIRTIEWVKSGVL